MTNKTSTTFDQKSLLVDGERLLLISGEIHYARSPREIWPRLLDQAVAMGLNCVAAYVFWNFHEPQKDVYDFSGQRDLGHFLELCRERKLHVLLRVGPYCCAEWNFGGFPPYLRDEPGIVIRTYNAPYLARVRQYFEHLTAEIRPHLRTNGGPVLLVQVENEYANVSKRYGDDGQRYLEWIVALSKELGIDVQTLTCEGGAPGSIECVNGHSIDKKKIAGHRQAHPEQPLIWTELWPAWYDTWGFAHHLRSAGNIAYHLLDFLGQGGSGWNYYMWHGGTNFGRTAMYLQTTSYDFDAPIDEYGRVTPKADYLAALHRVVTQHCDTLFGQPRRSTELGNQKRIVTWGKETVWITLKIDDRNRSAVLTDQTGACLFDTAHGVPSDLSAPPPGDWKNLMTLQKWESWEEPRPSLRFTGAVRSPVPLEQLSLTHDESDYCWYSAEFTSHGGKAHELVIPYGGDAFLVFVDGALVAQSKPPFEENRGVNSPPDPQRPYVFANALEGKVTGGFRQVLTWGPTTPGPHKLEILSVALGMIKGDWQISASMEQERKGIWSTVVLDGAELDGWTMHPGLVGEARQPNFGPSPGAGAPCTWYQTTFELSQRQLQQDFDLRLDGSGLGKGMAFLNGHALGRYWLIGGHGYGPDSAWQFFDLDGLSLGPEGEPTQRYYHLPTAWLGPQNTLVLFEEFPGKPSQLEIQVRNHPA